MTTTLRIVICGDEAVGKSTLLASFVKGEFVPSLQGVVPPVTISRLDYSKDPNADDSDSDSIRVSQYVPDTTVIVDTLASDHVALNRELKQADVILLVYLDHYTYERVSLYWMPMFRAQGVNLPVIVCATKSDATKTPFKQQNTEEFMPLINEFKEIEACVRCSAQTNANVVEAFYLCQRAVTHPISPIFDSKEGHLRPPAMEALKRIFFLCDTDQNGYLGHTELLGLHAKCFGQPLSEDEYVAIVHSVETEKTKEQKVLKLKNRLLDRGRNRAGSRDAHGSLSHFEKIKTKPDSRFGLVSSMESQPILMQTGQNNAHHNDAIHGTSASSVSVATQNSDQTASHHSPSPPSDFADPSENEILASRGLSESDFLLLNKMYVEQGRHETVWGILRTFHYTNSLSLHDKFLFPKLDVLRDSSVELSPTGFRFFVDLFIKFDRDNDGGLNDAELAQLFSPTPGIPRLWQECQFPESIVRNDEGYVSLQGWLAQWNLTTFLHYRTTLEYLAYLGFDEANSLKAIRVTKPRRHRQKQGKQYRGSVSDRNVFSCLVLGAPRSGKTSLLEQFIRGSYSEMYLPTIHPRICVKDIELRGGKQCYLILEELGELEPAVLDNPVRLNQCDVLCYTYDLADPELFQYLVELRKKYARVLDDIPSVFVALKADLDKQQQRSDTQPENYTRDLFLSLPLHILSAWTTLLNELFIQLVDAAKTPATATPGLETQTSAPDLDDLKHVVVAGGAIAVMATVSVWIWRSARRSQ